MKTWIRAWRGVGVASLLVLMVVTVFALECVSAEQNAVYPEIGESHSYSLLTYGEYDRAEALRSAFCKAERCCLLQWVHDGEERLCITPEDLLRLAATEDAADRAWRIWRHEGLWRWKEGEPTHDLDGEPLDLFAVTLN